MNKQSLRLRRKPKKTAEELHKNVPPDWYHKSIKTNLGQWFWHNMRFKHVEKMVEKGKGKILDIGSADGVFTEIITKKSGSDYVIGIDVLKSSVDWANGNWKNKKMRFKVGNAHKLDFKSGTFDGVFALEVLEHVHEPQKVLKEMKRVLKIGGYAVMLVPTDNKLFNIIWWFWTKWKGRIWDEAHIQSYKDNLLIKEVKKVGFKVDEERKFLLGMLHLVKVRKS